MGGFGLLWVEFGNNKSSVWARDISMVTMWEVRRRRSWTDTMENRSCLAAVCSFSRAAAHQLLLDAEVGFPHLTHG